MTPAERARRAQRVRAIFREHHLDLTPAEIEKVIHWEAEGDATVAADGTLAASAAFTRRFNAFWARVRRGNPEAVRKARRFVRALIRQNVLEWTPTTGWRVPPDYPR